MRFSRRWYSSVKQVRIDSLSMVSSFFAKKRSRSNLHKDCGKLYFAELDRGGHGDAPQSSDKPAAGMRDFSDQAVGMAAMEKTIDLRALTFWLEEGFKERRIVKLVADIGIGKTADTVLAV